jgi:predicted SprT family Zn-dependent metalloprotease
MTKKHYEKLDQVRELALQLMRKHKLDKDGWQFQWDHAKLRLGSCNYTYKTITLSKWYMLGLKRSEIKDTILHEIAHALVGPCTTWKENGRRADAPHGPAWKAMAEKIGATPKAKAKLTHEDWDKLQKTVVIPTSAGRKKPLEYNYPSLNRYRMPRG